MSLRKFCLLVFSTKVTKLEVIFSSSKFQILFQFLTPISPMTPIIRIIMDNTRNLTYLTHATYVTRNILCGIQVKRLAAVPSNITTGKVGKVSVSKRTPSSTNTETKSVQPSKRIKIELSLKSEQSPTTSEQSNPNPEPSKSDSVSSKPEDSETLSSPQKITKITEFSSSNETHVDSSSPQKTIDPITQISNQDQEQISRSKTISDQGSVNKETAPKPSDKQKKAPKKKAKKTTPQNATLSENVQWDDDIHDENFVNWTPPVGQSGDGRTKLNEKFGY